VREESEQDVLRSRSRNKCRSVSRRSWRKRKEETKMMEKEEEEKESGRGVENRSQKLIIRTTPHGAC
jgi:hypothetical protein